ncbi:MAG: glucuronate isomerase [Balneolaceae bacterium]|nr:glucuronate isomerase [Balneolaceae bacterium]
MSQLITKDFLLNNEPGQALYHKYAADQPIIDYHCHLPPADIAADRQFNNLTNIWLDGDHYKWRAMRTLGVDEQYITGDAPDKKKFAKWAETVPYTLRNPLYHWTHMELKRYFGIDQQLTPETADSVYEECTEQLQGAEFSTRSLIRRMRVEVIWIDPTIRPTLWNITAQLKTMDLK